MTAAPPTSSASTPVSRFSPVLKRFAPEIEAPFQADYYARVRATLRLVSPFMTVLLGIQLALIARLPAPYDLAIILPQLGFWSLIFALTWNKSFERAWQPLLVGLGWLSALLVLGRLAPLLTDDIARMRAAGMNPPTNPQQKFYFMLQFAVLLVSFTSLRLQFRWALGLYGGVMLIGTAAFLKGLPAAPDLFRDVRFVFLPGVLLLGVLLLTALVQEQLTRSAFEANRRLALLQAQEHQKRVETEKMLHVLNGAIGGIVHDLGNPLTSVQTGTETLRYFVEQDQADPQTVLEFADIIESGAKMLGFLRLSLIEQSRVLEGKPVPVELKPVAARAVVEAGASFQKPRFTSGHTLSIEGPELQICADEMKMVTVMMNLIGNALKYSDGEVCVAWRAHGDVLLLGVLDAGQSGKGITREQAARLFKAFGRLETHAAIEGTGLGLLSVQKIVEAHGGETFIEGYEQGVPNSPRFSTARGDYPTLLQGPSRTAFVITCPLATKPLVNQEENLR